MKLSILIPTFNFDCTKLVAELQSQLPADCEIIIADDGSTDKKPLMANRSMRGWKGVVYHEEERNQGRAGIRNRLAELAKGEYVLITDADARVISPDFLSRYMDLLPTSEVICGGIRHCDTLPSPEVSLRWRYEKACEPNLTAKRRGKGANQSLSTFNIMMPRSVILTIPFDEHITQYGYEDTLLGLRLQQAGIKVSHIDNPLLHTGLDNNEIFLRKTETAMHTLHEIKEQIGGYSQLLQVYQRLSNLHLTVPLRIVFRMARPLLRLNLLGSHPSVFLFNFYKLGYYATLSE